MRLSPNARLLRAAEEIEATRRDLPSGFLPFMIERQPDSTDVYGFESADEVRGKVVVWNDHAVVADWGSVEEFLNWACGDATAA
jgi:hypothetical protein